MSTSQVFAVERMVLSDVGIVDTDEFKGIAVSSGEWLPVQQVAVADISRLLREARSHGYTIIGLEQSDGSKSLEDFSSLDIWKCVLLVGKEREGIPADLLSEVDVCLEIPQFGLIRSLNVHVSTALALWEITKKNMASLRQRS